MDTPLLYEVIGYAGSALVILSLIQRSILRLRLVGLVGSLTFLVYSVLIEAYPIAVVNVLAAAIHLWYLRMLLRRQHEVFEVLHVNADSAYLAYFLDHYRDEIVERFQPGFRYEPADNQFAAFILRDLVPAGLFIGRVHPEDSSIEAVLDFVIPQYRDFKIGPYLYSERSGLLTGTRCTTVWSIPGTEIHARYLRRMGFRPDPTAAAPNRYSLRLAPPTAEVPPLG